MLASILGTGYTMSTPDKVPVFLDFIPERGERANMQICKTKSNNLSITDCGCCHKEWQYNGEGLGHAKCRWSVCVMEEPHHIYLW